MKRASVVPSAAKACGAGPRFFRLFGTTKPS